MGMDNTDFGILWLMICVSLVFIMQAGFLCLEAGLTRNKNSINVAIKNLADIGISIILYWSIGYAIMFGASHAGIFGTSDFMPDLTGKSPHFVVYLMYQAMFCGTAVTITSGAVAERMRFGSYLIIAVLSSSIVYPVFGHWAWNGMPAGDAVGWLGKRHFVDFAGATAVHSVGGWLALAAVLVIGPRHGRFTEDGARDVPGFNLPVAMVGVLLLAKGWIGFNGGGFGGFDHRIPVVLSNTMLSGMSGLLASLFLGWCFRRRAEIKWAMNGTLGGLVAITAGCHVVSSASAVVIGGFAAVVVLCIDMLLIRLRIDDAVSAIPVHLGAGVWGTLAVAVLGKPALLDNGIGPMQQLQAQIVGILACFFWVFGTSYIVLNILNRIFPLRVTAEHERIGLNVAEHGASTEILDLYQAMDEHARTGDFSSRAPVEPFTEVGQIANRYNLVMQALQLAHTRMHAIVNTARDAIITFSPHDLRIDSVNPAATSIFQRGHDDLVGRSIADLIVLPAGTTSDSGTEKVKSLLNDIEEAGYYQELTGCRAADCRFPVEVAVSSVAAESAEYYIGTFHDITARKQVEEDLQRARDLLQAQHDKLHDQHLRLKNTQTQLIQAEKVASLGTMVSGVAHEINNPNNFIHVSARGMVDDLQKFRTFIFDLAGDDADDAIRISFDKKFGRLFEFAKDIGDGSTQIKAIVEDLRTFSRLDDAVTKHVDIVDGLKSMLRIARTQYGEHVEFVTDFMTGESLECWPNQLNQVFLNITANACQAILHKQHNAGGPLAGRLAIRNWIDDGRMLISFADNGCGMAADVKAKVFDPFFTTKSVGEGTGLGMSVSFGIIERHRGRIQVESTPGNGTTVTLTLPLTATARKAGTITQILDRRDVVLDPVDKDSGSGSDSDSR